MANLTARLLAAQFTQDELEVKMKSLLLESIDGKTCAGWSAGDTSANKHVWMNLGPEMRLSTIAQALSILDPTTYPPEDMTPVTQTNVEFSNPFDSYAV